MPLDQVLGSARESNAAEALYMPAGLAPCSYQRSAGVPAWLGCFQLMRTSFAYPLQAPSMGACACLQGVPSACLPRVRVCVCVLVAQVHWSPAAAALRSCQQD